MYEFFHQLNYSNQIISDKINFFADSLFFSRKCIQMPYVCELENHISLLEKIKTQLVHYDKRYSNTYIEYYAKNPLLYKSDGMVKEFYANDFDKIISKKIENGRYKDSEEERLLVISLINNLLQKLQETYFKNIVSWLITILECSEDLENHNHKADLWYLANLMAAELTFLRVSTEEIKGLFGNLFNKEIIHYGHLKSAIVPKTLFNENENDIEKVAKINHYLSNITSLREQINRLNIYYEHIQAPITFFFKLQDVETTEIINLEVFDVYFSNDFENGLKLLKNAQLLLDYIDFHPNDILAYTTIKAGNKEMGVNKAIYQIEKAIHYLNLRLSINATLATKAYISIHKGHSNNRSAALRKFNPNVLNKDKLSKFESFKTYYDASNSAKKKFLKSEKLCFEAFSKGETPEMLFLCWQYLESFFENEKRNKIIPQIAKMIVDDYIYLVRMKLTFLALNIYEREFPATFTPTKGSNLTKEYFQELLKPGPYNLKEINEAVPNPVLNLIYDKHLQDEVSKSELKKYFENILREAYEHRNLFAHEYTYNEKTVQKLSLILPDMIGSFRRAIIKGIEVDGYTTINDIIESYG